MQQGKSDTCDANLNSRTPTASARGCMAERGYVLVRGIGQRTLVQLMLPLPNAVRPTDNEHSWQLSS